MDGSIDEESKEETDSLRIQCKYNGLPNYGKRGQLLLRLKKLKEFREQSAQAEEDGEITLDPDIDGEPLSDSDYSGCFEQVDPLLAVSS